jgi:hypothetical protein
MFWRLIWAAAKKHEFKEDASVWNTETPRDTMRHSDFQTVPHFVLEWENG